MKAFLVPKPKRPREDDDAEAGGEPSTAFKKAPRAEPSAAAEHLLSHLTGAGWRDALAAEASKPYFAQLASAVAAERAKSKAVYPPEQDTFRAFNLTPLDQVRVVIIGQDPYHGPGQAHGLSFSVPPGVAPPPSLKNIYKELADDLGTFSAPTHGNLEAWARRGVFMLNASLTVRAHEANSHAQLGWQTFTDAVIKAVNARCQSVVFILWGGFAKKKGVVINRQTHHVIETAHPSPLSVTKFRGCKCFSKARAIALPLPPCLAPTPPPVCLHAPLTLVHPHAPSAAPRSPRPTTRRAHRQTNEYLVRKGSEPIDWSLPAKL